MKGEGYCCLYDKFLSDFTKADYSFCINEYVQLCDACDAFVYREREENEYGTD